MLVAILFIIFIFWLLWRLIENYALWRSDIEARFNENKLIEEERKLLEKINKDRT